jgi:hypothetical protein
MDWIHAKTLKATGCRFSYAREERVGGPLLKGRKNSGATTRGESEATSDGETSMIATVTSEIPAAATPIGERPELQSPRQVHCLDWLSLLWS